MVESKLDLVYRASLSLNPLPLTVSTRIVKCIRVKLDRITNEGSRQLTRPRATLGRGTTRMATHRADPTITGYHRIDDHQGRVSLEPIFAG